MENKRGLIPFKDKAIWAACDGMGTLLAWNIFASYLSYYFTDVVGIALNVAGNIILIARSVDTVTDFLIGVAIDRINWKSGKYRGWLKIAIIPMTVQLPLIFAPLEGTSMTFRIIWTIIFFGTYGCIWNTMVCAPTHSQLVNMTTSIEERSSAIGLREVFYNIGMFLVSAAFLPLVNALGNGNENRGFFFASMVFAVIAGVIMLMSYITQKKYELNPDGTSKIPASKPAKKKAGEKGLMSGIKDLGRELVLVVKNRPAVIILVSVLLANTLMTIKSAMLIYSFEYYFEMQDFYAVAMGVFTVATIIGALLIKYFIRLFRDSNRAFKSVMALSIIFNVAFFIICRAMGPEAAARSLYFGPLFFIFIISAVFQGAHYGFANLMVPSVIDYGAWKNGKFQTGLIYGIYALDVSLGAAIGGKLNLSFLDAVNYVPNVAQTPEVQNGILFVTIMVPVIMTAAQLVLQFFFGLNDKKYQQCIDELEKSGLYAEKPKDEQY